MAEATKNWDEAKSRVEDLQNQIQKHTTQMKEAKAVVKESYSLFLFKFLMPLSSGESSVFEPHRNFPL